MVGPQGHGVACTSGARYDAWWALVRFCCAARDCLASRNHRPLYRSPPPPSLLSPFLFTIRERLPRRSPKIEIRSPLISSLSASDALHSGYSRRKCALMYFHGHSCNFLARTRTGFKARRANSPHVSPSRRPSVQGRPSGKKPFLPAGGVSYILNQFSPSSSSPSPPPPRDGGPRFN